MPVSCAVKRAFSLVAMSVAPLAIAPPAAAAFTFNFVPQTSSFSSNEARCNVSGYSNQNCSTNDYSNPDNTPFLQETVTISGTNYYHVIVGSPSSEFAMEYYIRQSGSCNGFVSSQSAGDCRNDSNVFSKTTGTTTGSGSATANPGSTAVRQILNTAEMDQEFLKDAETTKPSITQDLSASEITAHFSLDMRNSNYSTNTTAGAIENTLTLSTPGLGDAGDFDMATDAQDSVVTGGRYTWTSGSGNGSSYGTYTYFGGGFNAYNVDWAKFRDDAENASHGGCNGTC